MNKKNIKNRLVTTSMIVAVFLLILTASIALPIFVRFFYYAHISAMNLPEETGWSYAQIKRAYDEMINFCTLFMPFSTGDLVWSEEGKAHFADVRVLFTLDWVVMLVTGAYIATIAILAKYKKVTLMRFCGHGLTFYAAIAVIAIPIVVGALVAIDFDQAFLVFHQLFFPGKENWLFNPATDEIITVMPEVFFRNCAIFIGVGILGTSGSMIVRDCVIKRRKKRSEKEKENEGKTASEMNE